MHLVLTEHNAVLKLLKVQTKLHHIIQQEVRKMLSLFTRKTFIVLKQQWRLRLVGHTLEGANTHRWVWNTFQKKERSKGPFPGKV